MTKSMTYRVLARRLRNAGCTSRPGKGSHEVWTCPCGRHSTPVVREQDASPGVVRQVVQRLSCLAEGWLR